MKPRPPPPSQFAEPTRAAVACAEIAPSPSLYVRMYVVMDVPMYVCMYKACLYVCMYVRTYMYEYSHEWILVCIYIQVQTCMDIQVCIHIERDIALGTDGCRYIVSAVSRAAFLGVVRPWRCRV